MLETEDSVKCRPEIKRTGHTFTSAQTETSTFCNKDPVATLQVYEDMLALGIPPVTQHFVTLLGACCDMPMSAREIRQVYSRAMAFCAAQGGDCSVYAALLKFCVSQGIPEKAVDVWKAIQKVNFGLSPKMKCSIHLIA